ncbi:MAG: hypothetical protein WC934_02070 [Acidithiobacillus sp.]|jgi:hypothetical protein|uniref:hypothetical protein n=1 Tax=Acidithiobacillus sp. TaxID=1872118 RepID=UPI00355FC100
MEENEEPFFNLQDEKIYTKEQIKEITKKVRALAKTSRFHEEFSFQKEKKPNKTTIVKILDFRSEPFYDDYVKVASKVVSKRKTISPKYKDLYSVVKPIVKQCIDEDRIIYKYNNEFLKLREKIRTEEFHEYYDSNTNSINHSLYKDPKYNERNKMALEKEEYAINDFIKQKLNLPYIPCKKLKNEIKNTFPTLPEYDIEKESIDNIENYLKSVFHNEYYDVITPDLTEQDIIEKTPNFNFGLEQFIESFKDQNKKIQQKQEWKKKYISTENTKKYFNMLSELVHKDEIQSVIKDKFVTGLTKEVNVAVNQLPSYIEQSKKLKDEWNLLENKRFSMDRNQHSKEITILDKKMSEINGTITNFKSLIAKYWNSNINTINEGKVKSKAEELKENTISNFVIKNTEKMATILHKRPDCNQFDPQLIFESQMIEGNIHVKCSDAEFRVNNQLVYVPEGEKIAHFRFPTTFHDVKIKGKVIKMLSEREMNNEF